MSNPIANGSLSSSEPPRRWPAWVRFVTGGPTPASDEFSDGLKTRDGDNRLGFVMTGQKTIDAIVRAVHDSRNVMLVGPRGTGKSHMARLAVEQCATDPILGVVAVVEIQGDPNKPPSDYFDDGIVFSLEEPKDGPKRVFPRTVQAPFFENARKAEGEYGFEIDNDGALVLIKTVRGQSVRVNRVIVFWDEGNRSSPAMQNAMLSLLAEGIIRRDGKSYRFPPVACILTRNPDGYDAQSAKLPSPLIDRFGLQMYVYNPDLETFNGEILPAWYKRLIGQFQLEARVALRRLADVLTAININNISDDIDTITRTAEKLEGGQVRVRNSEALVEAYKKVESFLNYDDPMVCQAAVHASAALKRALRCPELSGVCALRRDAAYAALLILATWGDAREPAEKPGMQYLPWKMRETLQQLATRSIDPAGRLGRALKRVGDLTRYGTSIRAFIDILETLVGHAVRDETNRPGLNPVETNLDDIRSDLGLLLNHRCELSFNPDREPDKARIKTYELVEIATTILLSKSRERFRPLCAKDSIPPVGEVKLSATGSQPGPEREETPVAVNEPVIPMVPDPQHSHATDPVNTVANGWFHRNVRVVSSAVKKVISQFLVGLVQKVANTESLPSTRVEVPREKVTQRANEIWLRKGRPNGLDEQNWREAEAELRSELAKCASEHARASALSLPQLQREKGAAIGGVELASSPAGNATETRLGNLRQWLVRSLDARGLWQYRGFTLGQVVQVVIAVAFVTAISWVLTGRKSLHGFAVVAIAVLFAVEIVMGLSVLICKARGDRILGWLGAILSAVLVWMIMRGYFWQVG